MWIYIHSISDEINMGAIVALAPTVFESVVVSFHSFWQILRYCCMTYWQNCRIWRERTMSTTHGFKFLKTLSQDRLSELVFATKKGQTLNSAKSPKDS